MALMKHTAEAEVEGQNKLKQKADQLEKDKIA